MRLLPDTHAFLWWLAGNTWLSTCARRAMEGPANDVIVSAAAEWEITTKYRIGKLSEAAAVAQDVAGAIANRGFEELPITAEDAERAGGLPGPHGGSSDRILIAQAVARWLVPVSLDRVFDRYGVRRVW